MTALCDYKRLCFLLFLARRKKRPNWSNSKRRLQKKKPRQDEMMGKGMLAKDSESATYISIFVYKCKNTCASVIALGIEK